MSFNLEKIFVLLQYHEPDEVAEGVVGIFQQNWVQIAKLHAHFTARSILRVSQLLHLCLEVAARPRLEKQSNRSLVWAK